MPRSSVVQPKSFYYTVEQMTRKPNLLGPHEQIVLLAIMHIGDDAHGMTIRREVEERSGRSPSLGAVYTTLDRLRRKGFVRSQRGEATAQRGGRAKRFYRITAEGRRAIFEAQELLKSMTEGLSFRWSLE